MEQLKTPLKKLGLSKLKISTRIELNQLFLPFLVVNSNVPLISTQTQKNRPWDMFQLKNIGLHLNPSKLTTLIFTAQMTP